MSTTVITANDGTGDTTAPDAVHGYQAARVPQNRVHQIIGGGIGVTLIRPNPRSGTLRCVYETEADAAASLELHSRETTFTLANDDLPTIPMTYIVMGDLSVELTEVRSWVVLVGYQEIDT